MQNTIAVIGALLLALSCNVSAFPEIGFLGKLSADIPQTSTGWKKVSGWVTTLSDVKGLYNFDAHYSNNGDISITVSGVFFVSVTLPVSNADIGLFKAALLINDITAEKEIALQCQMENATAGTQMLSFSGFISLRAGEKVSINAYASTDIAWTIKSQASLTFHFFGSYGSTPGFLVTPGTARTLSNPKDYQIKNWAKTGHAGLFQSLTGLEILNGKFTAVCTGVNILAANIIFKGNAGTYSVSTVFNGKKSILGTVVLQSRGIATLNVYQAFFIPKASSAYLTVTSNAGSIEIYSQSTWSMAFIGGTSSNIPEFSSFIRSTTDQAGGSWSEVAGLLRTSATQIADGSDTGQFIEPSNLNLVNTQNFVMTDQTDLYYAFVHLVFSGNATGIETMIAVSADRTTSTGKEGVYGSFTKVAQQTGTMSLSGIFHIRKQEHLSVFVKPSDSVKIHNTSFVSFVRMRYVVSAFGARIQTKMTIQKSGWSELTGPWLTETYGKFSYGTDFHSTTGKFTASQAGVYIVSANIQVLNGDGADVALLLVKNGVIDTNNGLYAVNGQPASSTTLNLYGTISVKTGDVLTLHAYRSSSSTWEIDVKSGYSITYIGPNWAALGFHAVLSQDLSLGPGQQGLTGWTTNSSSTTLTYSNTQGLTSTQFTSQQDAIYIVSANILVQNASIPTSSNGDSEFNLQAYVNGIQANMLGLSDMKPSLSSSTRDYFTLSFSAGVRLKQGEYVSLFITSGDGSYTISKKSGLSVVLVTSYSNSETAGFMASKNVASYLSASAANVWTGLVDALDSGLPGRYTAGPVLTKTPQAYFSVGEPGLYYVFGNFRLDNAATSLFEAHVDIDSLSSVTYGLYSVEGSPKGRKYNLNFAGTMYLTSGQQIRVMVRTAKTSFTIDAGSSFAIIKLRQDEHFPGMVVDKVETSFQSNQVLRSWEETGKPGLFTSNVGFDAPTGTYTPPVAGVYVASINNYLGTMNSNSSISLIDNDSTDVFKVFGSEGVNRTKLATSAVFLNTSQVYSTLLNTSTAGSYPMRAGWSLYFINPLDRTTGFAGHLATDFTVTSIQSWTTVTGWNSNSTSQSFSTVTPSQPDTYTATKKGLHFISFNPVFDRVGLSYFAFSAIYLNSELSMYASFLHEQINMLKSLPVSGTVYLQIGDVVSFKVLSYVSNLKLTTETTRSLVFIDDVTSNTEGVAAHLPIAQTVSGSKTNPYQLKNFQTTKVGSFLPQNETLDSSGILVNFHAGVFLYTTNIVIKNTASVSRTFRMYVKLDNQTDTAVSLQSVQFIQGKGMQTLSFSSSMFLPRFTAVQTLVSAEDDASFEIAENSTITFVLIDDNTGPVLCEDTGLNLEALNPTSLRISTEKTATFTCTVVGNIPATLSWYKNGVVIPSETGSTLTISPTQVSHSGNYACKANYRSLEATTSNATLSVYDPTPSITALAYSASIQENLQANTLIQTFTLSADKFAIGQKAIVAAYIVAGDPDGDLKFSNASTTSVQLTTARPLDYEKKSFYQLSITVVNTEEPDARNTTISFNLTVIDVNDNGPKFTPSTINQPVPEDLSVGSHVLTVTAVDPDSGVFGLVNYSIVSILSRPFFAINSSTGAITLQQGLDREQEDRYIVVVQAQDSQFSSVAEVVINVTDVNDNRPSFNPSSYSLAMVENTLVSTSIVQVFASDPDLGLNSTLSYSILDGNSAGHFSINSQSGVITLVKAMDYEGTKSFTLLIGLRDQGNPILQSSNNATVTITIEDVNDNQPHFEKSLYTKSLAENTALSTSVMQVKAFDGDHTARHSNFTFSINQTLASNTFAIDPLTGVITLKKLLDYEQIKEYHFSVIATDNGTVPFQRHTNIIIYVTNVNDEVPYFMPTTYNVTLSEYARPGSMVIQLFGYDNDTKSLSFSISSQSPKGDFLLDSSSGALYVLNNLDRENITSYTLQVSLSDGSNVATTAANVTIHISDENDNRPVFVNSTYVTSLSEGTSLGSVVATVRATDLDIGSNAAITYSILNTGLNDSSKYFSINATTGVITLAKMLDYETERVHRFAVVATDGGKVHLTGYASVEVHVIDMNDNAPYFNPDSYTVSIPEAMNINNIVAVIKALDNDTASSQLSYEIVGGNVNNDFKMSTTMPNVLLVANSLDYERTKTYSIIIRAFDGKQYSTTNATISVNITDINDNNPIFNSSYYRVTIPENTNTTYVFLQVAAHDGDHSSPNNQITYSALENTTDFSISSVTGAITVNSVDYERQSYYSLVVIAQDNGTPWRQARALVDIIVTDINDNTPTWTATSYSVKVSEAALVGVQLTTVQATDKDSGVNGELVFQIVAGNGDSKFRIDQNTGAIILNGSLDYENAVKNYTLVIAVQDKGGLSAPTNATVFIQVFDINDNQPAFDLDEYKMTISENTTIGTSILTVHASDRDGTEINSGLTYHIVSSTDSGNFTINATTGVITSQQYFDYENVSRFSFEVEARDTASNMLKARALVLIQISDINDNAPVPNMAVYNLNVSTDTKIGSQVLTLFSTDKDSGNNAALQYSIISGDTTNSFAINNNGIITLAKTLDITVASYYNLVVQVQDQGSPQLSAKIAVNINVTRTPTSIIEFTKRHFTFYVNETTFVSLVGNVLAVDMGNLTSTYIHYDVVANLNQIQGIFHLDRNTGAIYMNTTTNHELKSQFDFTARAVNNYGDVAYTHVTIFVNDINEAPYFLYAVDGIYSWNISESVPPYSLVHVVHAADNDTGVNGQLTFSLLLSSAERNLFFITNEGRIYTKAELDYEAVKMYTFQVQVQDGGSPRLSATVNVTLTILDYNDNHPVFISPTPDNLTVAENTPSGTTIGTLNATDADSGMNSKIQYMAVYPTGILTVNASTGELQVGNASLLDYEKVQYYDLIAVVKDMGTPSLTTTKTIRLFLTNTNDNTPYFINAFYNLTVSEVTPVNTLILPLHALDADLGAAGTIGSYVIASGDTSKFRIDNNGKIYLNGPLVYSVKSMYTLLINATDTGIPSKTGQATVIINVLHVSRKQPEFILSTYYKTVSENNNISESLLQVNATSTEAVSGPLVYSIINNNVSRYFTIDNTTGIIKSLVSFDYEKETSYAFTVQVLDQHNQRTGIAHVVIYVTDLNDNSPVFTNTKLTYNISEATLVGSMVISLSAADNDSTTNSMLQYTAVSGNGMDKFVVETDGRIYLKSPVDSKVRNNYTLTVKVEDMGSPKLHSNITLTIYINPANLSHLSQPMFNQSSYSVSVNEGITKNSIITVLATNQAISSTVSYSIVGSASETSPFTISSSGAISLVTQLDYELKNVYRFTVRATNSEGRTSDAMVTVYVVDVNDNRPVFMPAVYTREISEYSPIGRTILHLIVKDNDTVAANGPYHYNFVSGNDAGHFNITSSGYIIQAKSIDYETMAGTSFTLTISVSEGGNPSISNATVVINIGNQNDRRPVFSQSIYNFKVNESAIIGTFVGMLNATDADRISPSNQITFSLVSTNNDFALSSNGTLTVNRSLDYEKVKSYEFVVVAMDAGSPSLKETAIIKVNVIDANEERPYFKQTWYSANISEAFPVGSTVVIVTASDDDSGIGGTVTYTIHDATSKFSIDSAGHVRLSSPLDFESTKNYTFIVSAQDLGGNRATNNATVYIRITEVNDNEPRFSSSYYQFSVWENATINSVLGQVSASDADDVYNTVTYSIVPNKDSSNFAIHNNGSITLNASLDYEAVKSYSILVRATDNGSPSLSYSAVVVLNINDVNDNAPMFPLHCNNTVSETSPIGMVVLTCKAMDADSSASLTYSINGSNLFSVDNDGVITLTKSLDYSNASVHNLTLVVSDGVHQAHKDVKIYVTAVSICRPIFNQSLYVMNIREDSHITMPVLTVLATDPRNKTLTYSMEAGVTAFSINPSTGLISTAKLLDYLVKNTYIFKVYASGGSSTAESIVIINLIDVNNRQPNSGQLSYTVQISEKAAIGAIVVGINATDPDLNSRLTYSIKSGNHLNSFRIDTNGRILVNRALDYELIPQYKLLVGVNDGLHEITVPVTINVVDINEPTTCSPCTECPYVSTFDFNKPSYVAQVSENTTANAVIATVDLNQAAKNRLIVGNYSIQDAKALTYFSINRTTGQITLRNSLDAATLLSLRKYTFTVYNQFKCRQAAAEIILDVTITGCPFIFSRHHYEITLSEIYPVSQTFLTVTTKQFTASAVYSIVENASKALFQINPTTGALSLRSSLNYEMSTRHQFTVMVNVTNLISYVTVIVYVSDHNDNCPHVSTINGTYYQPVQAGSIMGRVSVNDPDTFKNHTFTISSGDTNLNFSIDSNGVVTARTVITSANKNIYNLLISVSDGSCTRTATMYIVIMKDTPPPCPTPPSCYNYTCAPCATTQPVTNCPKKICPGCPACPTTSAPCPTTAKTTACPVVTCPSCPTTCPATVTCGACPTLQCPSCRSFTAYIFKKPYYTVNVYENTTVPSSLLSATINGAYVVNYTIVEPSARSMFDIDSVSGKITLKSSLNYTLQKTHQFTVRAMVSSEYSDAIVVVNVLDVNNNCPVFAKNEVHARLTSPVESGTIIAINKATDADASPSLTYSISAGDTNGEFTIDNMGVIRTQKRVVIAGSKTFNLTLTVSDGVCKATSKAVIIIHLDTMFTVTPSKCPVYCPVCPACTGVPSVTTAAPVTCPSQCPTCLSPSNYMFSSAQYVTILKENTTYSSAILHVRLLSGSAAVNYSIVQANALEYFNISRSTGEIFLVKVLDYEKAKRHLFNVRAEFAGGVTANVSIDIYVADINDNHPYFVNSSYTVQVHEYTAVGTVIAQIMAADRDSISSVKMTLASGNTNSLFSINQNSGKITLASSPYLYTQNTYTLKIKLTDDGGLGASIMAIVTVNIVRLTATRAGCQLFGASAYIKATLPETAAIGSLVVQLSGTPVASNRNIVYSIANLDGNMYFQINSTTGRITTKASLDYEKMSSHVIVVNGQDQVTSITSVAFVLVNVTNVNDNSLSMTIPASVTVSELSSKGSFVVMATASDKDSNAVISYSITSGNTGGFFLIDPVTGIVTLNKSLNHDSAQSHAITICANESSSGVQVCKNIVVAVGNENNKQTVFGQSSYVANAQQNTTVGTVVATVSATDPDGLGSVTYSLDGALANEYFAINSTTGAITLKKSLSGATLPSPFVLNTCARDAASPATTTCVPVVVSTGSTVIAPNFYYPYFIFGSYSAVINENATIGTRVFALAASDNDTGAAGAIHYNQLQGTGADYFTVDSRTGVVSTVKSLNSSSAPKVFFLRMSVRDYGSPVKYSLAPANITIGVLQPAYKNNSITAVNALTMQISLTKEPFEDSKIIKYEIVAQRYEPTVANFEELSAMHPVSWYYVHFIPETYQYRRFVIATITKFVARRKRRAIQETSKTVNFDAGIESGCNLKTLENQICNGPLLPGKNYRFQLVGYYTQGQPVTGAFTDPKATTLASIATQTGVSNSAYIATYWIIGLVVLSLMFFLAVLVIVIIFCYKRKYRYYDVTAKTFTNPMYAAEPETRKVSEKSNLNFYASDTTDGYAETGTLKEEKPQRLVIPEEFEMIDQPPVSSFLVTQNTPPDYETISNKITFEEEKPEWTSMDISLKIDPSGKSDPVIITRGERSSDDSDSAKKNSVSSGSDRGTPIEPERDYDDALLTTSAVRVSVGEDDDGYDDVEGITKL